MRRSALVLALALLAACGGGGDDEAAGRSETAQTSTVGGGTVGGVTPEDYAGDVCRSIGSWYDEIDQASTALLADADQIEEDPAAGKALVVGFLDDAIGFTDGLIAGLEEAGVPETDGGQRTADELVAGIEEVRELFRGARDDTEALPTDDPQALGTGLQDIGAALQDSATAVGANFEAVLSSVDDPELASAFQDAPACQELTSIS